MLFKGSPSSALGSDPEKAFDRVLKKHPRGVILEETELRLLLKKAGLRPNAPKTAPAPPIAATIERLTLVGTVEGEFALIQAEAEVAVLKTGTVGLPLPSRGSGCARCGWATATGRRG